MSGPVVTLANVRDIAFPVQPPEPPVSRGRKVCNVVVKPTQGVVSVMGKSVESTNALEKSAKFLKSILRLVYDIAINFFKVVLGPFKLIVEEMGFFIDLFEGLNFIGRIGEWLSKKDGKSFCQANSGAKVASRACLTVAHGIQAGIFLEKIGLVNFAKFVNFLGSIPILRLLVSVPAKIVKDLFVIGSSIFGIWASFQTLAKARKQVRSDQRQIEKWERIQTKLGGAVTIDQKRTYLNEYREKISERRNGLYDQNDKLIDAAKQKEAKQLDDTLAIDFRSGDDATIERIYEAHKTRVDLKARQWQDIKKLGAEENLRRTKVKTWVAVAYDISKIAICAMVVIGHFAGISLWFGLSMGVVGLISAGFGWGKVLADGYNSPVKNPKILDIAEKFYTKQTYIANTAPAA